ncbi:DUF6279 family lipoprotein [Litorivivens sp.]|uniref:DUF6279 family lipoprotein n=1 Tax=Litorivivens sp. TaxID=2020868 RepID=UPI00356667BA
MKARTCLSLIVLLFISGCSATQFFYNRADWFIERAVKDYVDLTPPQTSQLETTVEQWLAWHRLEELPNYVDLLERMQVALGKDFSEEHYDALTRDFETAWYRARDRAIADAAPMLAGLSDTQVAGLLQRLTEKHKEYFDKHVAITDRKRIKQRNERVVDQLERWLGSATPAQKRVVADWAGRAPDSYPIWFRLREHRQQAFAELLAARQKPAFSQRLQQLLADDTPYLEDWEQRQLQQNRDLTKAMLLTIENSLTQQQRDHLLAELRKIAEDIRKLLEQS